MRFGSAGRPLSIGAATTLVALALAAAAVADKEQIKRTPAGNAEARAAVLERADFGGATGWTGKAQTPDLSSTMPCNSFHPKQSDLVVIGAAEAKWTHPGVEVDSEAQVLQTPQMVALDWQRTVMAPQVLPCLREGLTKALSKTDKLEWFAVVAFPRVGDDSRRLRAVIAAKYGTIIIDSIAVKRHATEITLTFTAPQAAAASLDAAEVILAQRVAARAAA